MKKLKRFVLSKPSEEEYVIGIITYVLATVAQLPLYRILPPWEFAICYTVIITLSLVVGFRLLLVPLLLIPSKTIVKNGSFNDENNQVKVNNDIKEANKDCHSVISIL